MKLGTHGEAVIGLVCCGVLLGACRNDTSRGGGPPPPSSAVQAAEGSCATQLQPVFAPLPLVSGEFCVEGSGQEAFGNGSDKPIADVAKLFDGGAEVYLKHKADRIVQVKYVSAKFPGRYVSVTMTRADSKENAFGMFSLLLIGERDPTDESLPQRRDGSARMTFGTGNAYVWKGSHVVELVYGDDQATPDVLKREGTPVLEVMAKSIGDALPGDANLPELVAALPAAERLELGERFVVDQLFGVDGLQGAVGYYQRKPDKRYRIAVVAGPAETAESKLKKLPGFRTDSDGFALKVEELGSSVEWNLVRKGDRLLAVGDEARVLRGTMPEEQKSKLLLSVEEKRKLLQGMSEPK